MFKSTLFIAVKCCECATMQVKQQKKSSNKWNCVVCNQKQSVTKIYAQGYQAKDIRNVVQSFNMSRKHEDDQLLYQIPSLSRFVEHDERVQEAGENIKGKRRTDWSEYVDDDDNVEPTYLKSKHIGKEMVDEAKVVTELSEDSMFMKPRLKGNFGSGNNESFEPNFSKRDIERGLTKEIKERSSNVASVWDECIVDDSDPIRDVSRRHCKQQGQQKQQNKVLAPMQRGTSKQYQYTAKNEFPGDSGTHSELQKQQQPNKPMAMMKAASKWSKYMPEEDDNDGGGEEEVRASTFADNLSFMRVYKPENDDVDQLIEEEIHPDFM